MWEKKVSADIFFLHLTLSIPCENNCAETMSLVSWCFKPSRPLGIISGLLIYWTEQYQLKHPDISLVLNFRHTVLCIQCTSRCMMSFTQDFRVYHVPVLSTSLCSWTGLYMLNVLSPYPQHLNVRCLLHKMLRVYHVPVLSTSLCSWTGLYMLNVLSPYPNISMYDVFNTRC